MFLVIDISAPARTVFHYRLDNRFARKSYAAERGENVLVCLEKFLRGLDMNLADIKYLGVVTGRGGFTATRLAVTAANALAYALKIPVIGLAAGWDGAEAFARVKKTPVGRYVVPSYSGEANIGKKKP